MIAILGGLGAAAAWAISTLCSSRSSRLIAPPVVVAWVMVVGLLISGPLAAAQGIPAGITGEPGMWMLIAGVGNVAGLVFDYSALRVGQVALVAPLVSTEGAVAAVIAVAAGESLAPGVGVALGVIVAGVCVASTPAAGHSIELRASYSRAVLLALVGACSFGVSLYATGRAGSTLPAAWVVLAARLIGTVALALPLAVRARLPLTRQVAPLVAISGICEVLGFYSFTAGARHGIAIAAVLSSQFGALAAIAGYFLFGERLTRLQVSGVATVVAGVAVLSALHA